MPAGRHGVTDALTVSLDNTILFKNVLFGHFKNFKGEINDKIKTIRKRI